MFYIFLTGFVASLLTFFSGFGLGTLLLPAMAFFLPLEAAIVATAIVHFFHNVFKAVFLRQFIRWRTALPFAISAWSMAPLGALLLAFLVKQPPITSYTIFGQTTEIYPINLLVGSLMILFALIRGKALLSMASSTSFGMASAGAFSGFFGGVSGYQGAFRSAVLIRVLRSTPEFIATGAVIACGVDFLRMLFYFWAIPEVLGGEYGLLVWAGVLGAILGVILGRQFVHRISKDIVQAVLTAVLCLLGVFIGTGWLG